MLHSSPSIEPNSVPGNKLYTFNIFAVNTILKAYLLLTIRSDLITGCLAKENKKKNPYFYASNDIIHISQDLESQ